MRGVKARKVEALIKTNSEEIANFINQRQRTWEATMLGFRVAESLCKEVYNLAALK